MIELWKKTVVHVLVLALVSAGLPIVAQAEIIGTLAGIESSLESGGRAADLAKIGDLLARDEARARMRALGVDEDQVEMRLARLTDAELNALAKRVDEMPAGAGVLEVVGIVFVVLLILEAVGVIDIFKKFP
jgi:hypothetical protein